MITPDQDSAARKLLGWSLIGLSNHSGVSDVSIEKFEKRKLWRPAPNVEAIQRALEAAGVEFTNGNRSGVRLARIQDRERTGKDFI